MPKKALFTLAMLLVVTASSLAQDQPADTPLPLKAGLAYPNLRIRRPVVVTNAGDGSQRTFVVTQQGVIQILPEDRQAEEAAVFLDIESRVMYKDRENEEGLLGLAFHPRYRENGQFFVYYTTKDAPHTSVISRFRVSADPQKGDPASEEELLRIPQPFWNHNGGNMVFGPDGYLYIGLGDGGNANDPLGHGQNLGTLLGSILRIDVDHRDPGLAYAIPKDNPFVGKQDARGEIWAYGLRNVWGMSFDRLNGTLWAADVGQNLWEEINIITRGGNYGWSIREAKHPFGPNGVGPRADLVDPVWEYHHDVGKSITGGCIYRGQRLPEIAGCYLYADYISGKLWALKYDYAAAKPVTNFALQSYNNAPIIAFGQSESGEVFFTDSFGQILELQR
jgi:quinoprotein glucose dehydrogenase